MRADLPRTRATTAPYSDYNPLFPADCDYVRMKVKRGTVLYRTGEMPGGIIQVLGGLIAALRVSDSGREIAVGHVAAGEICPISLLCISAGAASPVDAVMLEDGEVRVLPKREFDRLREVSNDVPTFVTRVLLNKTYGLINRIEEVAFLPMRVRLEQLLQHHGHRQEDILVVTMTHSDIARNLGTSREVISRLLLEMEAEGVVELYRARIHVYRRSPGNWRQKAA